MAAGSAGGSAARPEGGDDGPRSPRRGSFVDTLRAVSWAFFGVRKRRSFERDVRHLNPVHVVLVGLLLAAVFVGVLVTLARFAAG